MSDKPSHTTTPPTGAALAPRAGVRYRTEKSDTLTIYCEAASPACSAEMRPIATYVACGLSVCLLVTRVRKNG